MKFSALKADFSSPSADSRGSVEVYGKTAGDRPGQLTCIWNFSI